VEIRDAAFRFAVFPSVVFWVVIVVGIRLIVVEVRLLDESVTGDRNVNFGRCRSGR
jgi:hypothetical protein